MKQWMKGSLTALALGAALAVPGTASAAIDTSGVDLFAGGTTVKAVYLFEDAGDVSNLSLFLPSNQLLFKNDGSFAFGSTASINGLTIGDLLRFQLVDTTVAGTFYSGAAGLNPDNKVHAAVSTNYADFGVGALSVQAQAGLATLSGPVVFIGFEDRAGGDYDYNDLIFAFAPVQTGPGGDPTGVPEPASLLLLGGSLLGLGVARRRKSA